MDETAPAETNRRGSLRNIRLKGFLLFCGGPLLLLLQSRLAALHRPAPDLLFIPLAIAAMFVGGLILVMGTERCVACDRRKMFFPGGQIGDDWVCPDCLLPYVQPVVINECVYCGAPWEIRNRHERRLAIRAMTLPRCPHCGAPVDPAGLNPLPG